MLERRSVPPVLVIGMHRSGTTLVVRILEELGLFVGQEKEENNEATFFLDLNEWLLKQAGAAWDNPKPIQFIIEQPRVMTLVRDYLELSLASPRVIRYVGLGRYVTGRRPPYMRRPWGWKDPRNTFTLPIWQLVFPKARVIHVFRHGVDVANSLAVRYERELNRGEHRYWRRRPLYYLRAKRGGFSLNPGSSTLDVGFSLWETYMTQARTCVSSLGKDALEIRYETLLEDPLPSIRRLARICSLDVDDAKLEEVATRIRPSRALAHLEQPQLVAFADRMRQRLQKHGYG